MSRLGIDPVLLDCVVDGTLEGLMMAGVEPVPVGASRMLTATRQYSVLVSVYGERNGTITLNFSEHTAAFLASRMLGEEEVSSELNEDTFDAISEIGNIIAGVYKSKLAGTPFAFKFLSLPALIVGAAYNVYHSRGFETACVEFEITEIPVTRMKDKFFTSSLSMLRK